MAVWSDLTDLLQQVTGCGWRVGGSAAVRSLDRSLGRLIGRSRTRLVGQLVGWKVARRGW